MLRPRKAWNVQQFQHISSSIPGLARSPCLSGGTVKRSKHDGRAIAVYHPTTSELFYTEPEVLTGFLNSSFFQYKTATDYVASWLENTAKSCGYSIEASSTNDEAPSKGLTGKARMLACDAKTAADSTASEIASQTKPVYTRKIPINKFVSMADFIAAASNPPVQVPASFMKALDSAISIRRRHGRQRHGNVRRIKCKKPQNAESRGAMTRHCHFIGVLEHVREALRPRMSSDQVKDPFTQKAGELSTETMDSLNNKFEGLAVQEPSGWFLQNPDVAPSTSSTSATPEVSYDSELRQEMEKAYLGFELLIQDLRSLRTVIHRTWKGYQFGVFDLMTVSLLTNTAIDTARRMQEDVQKIFDKHGGSAKMLNTFYGASCAIDGEDPNFRERLDDDLNFRVYDTTESMMMPTFMLLQSLSALVEPGNILPYKRGHYGTFDPASDRSKKSAREKFQEDKIVLLEVLSEFLTFHRGVPSQPFEDEFTRGLRFMFDTKDIPIWLVFAAQVFLDIHHALRIDAKKGFYDPSFPARSIETSLMENLSLHSSLTITGWPRQNKASVETLRDVHRWMDCDPAGEPKGRLQVEPGEMFKLMKWNPLLCGMFMRHVQLQPPCLPGAQPALPSCVGADYLLGPPVQCHL